MMGGLSTSSGLPRRLSKPRTNTSSTILPGSSDREMEFASPSISTGRQDYFGDYAAVVSYTGERRSRRKSRSRIRAYLHGSNSETTQTQSEEEDGQNTIADAARDVRKRLSRTGSSVMQLQSAKASTARLSDSSSSRAQLNGSQSSDAEESAMIADQIKERAYHDRLAAQNHIATPVDEDKHVDSVMAPLRRKSLYTPGLATRNPSDILKKPPQPEKIQPQTERDYYHDPARPQESPLSQLAALQFGEDGRSTPSNINYSQLGGLQLGTLRVTNGSASPIPRVTSPEAVGRVPTPTSRSQDEFYTASEGSIICEGPSAVAIETKSQQFPKEHNTVSHTNVHGSITPLKAFPSIAPDRAVSIAYEYMSELGGSPFSCSDTPKPSVESTPTKDSTRVVPQADNPALDIWRQFIDDAEIRHGGNGTQEDAFHKLNGDTLSALESHHQSVPSAMDSRFSVSNDISITDSGYVSKASLSATRAVAQTGPESPATPEMLQEPSPMSIQNNCLEPRPFRLSEESTPSASPSPNRNHGILVAPIKSRYHTRPDSLVKSESSTGIRCVSGPRDMPRPAFNEGKSRLQPNSPILLSDAMSTIMTAQTVIEVSSSARFSPTVTRKLQKSRPKSQPPPASITVQGCHELLEAHIPRVPSIIAARHADRLRQFPLLDHTFPSLQHTTTGDGSSFSDADLSAYAVPIRFPSPANALEAAVTDNNKELVSTDGRRRSCLKALSRSRTSTDTPDRGIWSRSRELSKHRHTTTVPVQDDEWPASGIVRSPSWSEFGGGRRKKEQKRLIKQEKEDEKRLAKEEKELQRRLEKARKGLMTQMTGNDEKHRSLRSRSASRTRGVSNDRSSQHDTMAIADFGTVTESLGGSPYDIATAMFPNSKVSHTAGNWHPHQISTAVPRPKSVVGTDEEAAAESVKACSRSRGNSIGRTSSPKGDSHGCRDRKEKISRRQTMFVSTPLTPAVAAVDFQTHNLEWARSQQRSTSFTGTSLPLAGPFNDLGGLPGRSKRPQSTYMDLPPVPVLPSIQKVKEREAQIAQSRPHSRVIDAPPFPTLPIAQKGDHEKPPSDSTGVAKLDPLVRPHKTKASMLVPDLWSNGSLEKKGNRVAERPAVPGVSADTSSSEDHPASGEDNIWKTQIQAWRMRRKSAGEALLRNQITELFDSRSVNDPSSPQEQRRATPRLTRALTTDPQQSGKSPSIPLPNPLASHPPGPQVAEAALAQPNLSPYHPSTHDPNSAQPAVRPGASPLAAGPKPQIQAPRRASTFTVPRKRVGSGASTPTKAIDRLTGRYSGGLQYGYEPGSGVGGSAGTRGFQTAASRKSIDVSKGFGLDLSDVPIFVASTPAH